MNTHEARMSWSRRRVLKTMFCSSAMLALNLSPRRVTAAQIAGDDMHWIAIGDFGSQQPPQTAVANGMARYVQSLGLRNPGLMLLGDNFYSKMEGGVESPRWKSGFEQMYPASVFPGPAPAVLGNHDYHDNKDGEQTQLAYAKTKDTRWTMPAKWYRMDFPAGAAGGGSGDGSGGKPLLTLLCIDTNLPDVSGPKSKDGDNDKKDSNKDSKGGGKSSKPRNPWATNALSQAETDAQWKWLDEQLAGPRAAWTIVAGHHPVYSNGSHGDTKGLVKTLGPRLQQHKIPIYLCGHDHDMQHLQLEGLHTSFIISGGGGARLRELKNKDRAMPFGTAVYGFSHLQINPDRILLRHLDANGKQIHAFEKRPDGGYKILGA